MKYFLLLLWGILIPGLVLSQEKLAYKLFDHKGKPVKYSKVLKKTLEADVVFFGELHNNPIGHWMQYELLSDLIKKKGTENLVVGAEMFETDQQKGIDAYYSGTWSKDSFLTSLDLWPNYKTDYQPVFELAKAHSIPFVATNIPRKYARKVFKEGMTSLDSLSNEEKKLIVQLPFEVDYDLPSYKSMVEMMGSHGHGISDKAKNFVDAQAIKDATMAERIIYNLIPDGIFLHLNGSFHSDFKEGIIWYLNKHKPEAKVINFSVVQQAEVDKLEKDHHNKADFIIAVPASMTKTY